MTHTTSTDKTIDQIFSLDCVYGPELRQGHIDSVTKRGVPIVTRRKERKGKIAIVASGPSAADYIDLLKEWDGEIWAVNGAFEWLLKRGVKPSAFVGLDPEPILKGYLLSMPDDATYYLAAQVHPEVYDHLEGKNVRVWFPADTGVKFPFGAIPVYGGSTCLGRAPNLAYLLGWREAHIFGGDSSYRKRSHVYGEDGDLPGGTFPVEWHGKTFLTTRQMFQQACEFVEQMVEWARSDEGTPLEVTLYGDGLMQAMFAQSVESGGYYHYLGEIVAEKARMNRKQRRAMRAA